MEGYDINKIKLKSDKTPPIEQLLTGKHITGIDKPNETPPNAELEGGEYLKFPDGTVQLVAGESHDKGGAKFFLPDGAKIASNALKPTGKQKRLLKKDYDIKVGKTDTYADVIGKYNKTIGVEKNFQEQEEIIKEIKKIQENETMPESTRNINLEYLSGKLNDLSEEAKVLEKQTADFFDYVFGDQEEAKSAKKAEAIKNGNMKYGGVSQQQFKELCDQHGISVDQGLVLIGEKVPSFGNGGEFDKLKKKYDTEEKAYEALKQGLITDDQYNELSNWFISENEFKSGKVEGIDYERPAGKDVRLKEGPYGQEEAFDQIGIDRLNSYRKKYEELSGGKTKFKKVPSNASKETIEKAAGELQAYIKKEYPELVYDYIMTKSHKPSNEIIGLIVDANRKAGKNYSLDNEGLAKAVEDGALLKEDIVNGYQDNKWWYRMMDVKTRTIPKSEYDELIKREGAIKQGDNLYFSEDPDNPEEYTMYVPEDEEAQPPAEEPKKQPESEEIVDEGIRAPRPYYPRMFNIPNQIPRPPEGVQAHFLPTTRFQRMEPIRIGIEPQLQEAGKRREFFSDHTFGNLPPNVAASVMANQMANETRSINQAAREANVINAQNLANTELFNIGQAGKENEAMNRNLLGFEQRQFLAMAKTEEELRNWEDQVRRIHVNNFKINQNLNLLNQMFPDYNLASTGMTADYEPSSDWKIKESNPYYGMFGSSPWV